jgi:hypothetical protein
MGAPTTGVRQALAQAGDKGLLHLAVQANTGTWLGRCGRQVRGRDIRIYTGADAVRIAYDVERAELEGRTPAVDFCPDCADLAAQIGRAIEEASR